VVGTPEAAIVAFLRAIRDPAFSYHLEGSGRWRVGSDEFQTTTRGDFVGDDFSVYSAVDGDEGGTLVVRGDRAAGRLGEAPWQPIEAELLRLAFDLGHTVIVGDLGPEPDSGRFRLVVTNGFELSPERATPFTSYSPIDDTIELLIDADGLPQRLTYHLEIRGDLDGRDVTSEGFETYVFSRIGEAFVFPEPEVQGTPPPTPDWSSFFGKDPSFGETSARWQKATLPGGALVIDVPGEPIEMAAEVSLPGQATILPSLVVEAISARFAIGDIRLPRNVTEGRSDEELDQILQGAVTDRLSNATVLGYRAVTVAGHPGREIVVESGNSIVRIRNVVIDGRFITISVTGPARAVGSAEADRFLYSLRS
jgi:hypothetical protein